MRESFGTTFREVAGRDIGPAHAENGALASTGNEIVGDEGRTGAFAHGDGNAHRALPDDVPGRGYVTEVWPPAKLQPVFAFLDHVAGEGDVPPRADAGPPGQGLAARQARHPQNVANNVAGAHGQTTAILQEI